MTRYLLDTNIISNLVKPQPSEGLMAWMAARQDRELNIAALILANSCEIVTDNERDFHGLPFLNPLRG